MDLRQSKCDKGASYNAGLALCFIIAERAHTGVGDRRAGNLDSTEWVILTFSPQPSKTVSMHSTVRPRTVLLKHLLCLCGAVVITPQNTNTTTRRTSTNRRGGVREESQGVFPHTAIDRWGKTEAKPSVHRSRPSFSHPLSSLMYTNILPLL